MPDGPSDPQPARPGFAERIGANRTVVALSAARLGDAVGNSILFIILPLDVARLPAPWLPVPEPIRVGILISLYGLVNSALQPVGGLLSDRLNRRKLFIQIGLALMGVATLAFTFATRFSELVVLRALQGVGVAMTVPASMSIMAGATVKQSRGGSMGIYTSTRMVGFTAGPLIGGFFYDRFGFDVAFFTGGGFILVAMLLVGLWVKETGQNVPSEEGRRMRFFDRALVTPAILGLGAATFVMAASFSMMTTLEKQFNTRLSETAFGFSIAFSALMVSRLLFQFPLGRVSDRVGRKSLIVFGLLAMALFTAPLGIVTTTAQLTALRVLQGIASAAIAAPAFALAADLAKAGGEGRQMSIVTMGFGLGIALGPLTAGVLAVVFFELPFLIAGVVSVAGAWVVFRYVPETVKRAEVSN
jgi:MFS family permease